jgi:D-alanyl-lipoteichoic acid acyltransferase DltB (MBOAT superfamily)
MVSGFWHGANWTFIAWGTIHAFYFIPLLLLKKNRKNQNTVAENTLLPSLKEMGNMGLTFLLVVFAWIFFRSNTISEAFDYFSLMLNTTLFSTPEIRPYFLFVLLLLFLIIEWLSRRLKYGLAIIKNGNGLVRLFGYVCVSILILVFSGEKQEFIYFQF